jgi:hypothetical protein
LINSSATKDIPWGTNVGELMNGNVRYPAKIPAVVQHGGGKEAGEELQVT